MGVCSLPWWISINIHQFATWEITACSWLIFGFNIIIIEPDCRFLSCWAICFNLSALHFVSLLLPLLPVVLGVSLDPICFFLIHCLGNPSTGMSHHVFCMIPTPFFSLLSLEILLWVWFPFFYSHFKIVACICIFLVFQNQRFHYLMQSVMMSPLSLDCPHACPNTSVNLRVDVPLNSQPWYVEIKKIVCLFVE